MRHLEGMLRQVFHGVLRRFEEQGVSPPTGTERVEIFHDSDPYRDGTEIRIDFDNGWRQNLVLPHHIVHELRGLERRAGRHVVTQLTRDVSRLYAEMYEEWYAEAGVRTARAAIRHAQREGLHPDQIEPLLQQYRMEQENLANHRRAVDPPMVMGADFASGPDRTVHWGGRPTQRRYDDAVIEQMTYASNNTGEGNSDAFTVERFREAYRILDEASRVTPRMWEMFDPFGDHREGTKKAKEKALKLLKDNLTKEQLACYEKNQYFEVIGGKSGTRYRIKHGRQMNIEVLDKTGNKTHGLCFLPVGGLVEGDCMLAQKNALELFEEEALKVANVIGGGPLDVRWEYSNEVWRDRPRFINWSTS
jgi:hypothetical protein